MSVESLKKQFEKEPAYHVALSLIEKLEQRGFEAYIVGGAVRDALLKRPLFDFDLTTSATPEEMKSVFKDFKLLTHGEAFGTLTLVLDEENFEITSFRGESDYRDSRHPDKVDFIASLEEDLKRRDFTINALAFHPKKGLFDFHGGLEDLNLKKLQTVGDPKIRFEEDALRIARAIRFAVQLNFNLSERTSSAIIESSGLLKKISKERIFSEFEKALKDSVYFSSIQILFGDLFEKLPFFLSKKLSNFEKAFLALKLCDFCKVDPSNYVLSKKIKEPLESFLKFKKFKTSDEVKSLFVKTCSRYEVFNQEQQDLWALVAPLLDPSLDLNLLSSFSREWLDSELKILKSKYCGAELGQELLALKKKRLFS